MWIGSPAFVLGASFAAVLLCTSAAPASGAGRMHATTVLAPTAKTPNARGRAQLDMKSVTKGRLRVSARGLAASSTFDVIMDGVKVGTLATNPSGKGKLTLSTRPKGRARLLGGDPRGDHLEVRDHDGDDDLECHLPGGDHPQIACCRSDDGSPECDLASADECTNEGGTPAGSPGGAFVSSCIPNPCTPTPPPPGGSVCCFPSSAGGAFVRDEDHECHSEDVACREIDAMTCGNAGGTVVEAASCDPNPCVPVQPPLVACCLSGGGDDAAECAMLTTDRCTAHQGTVSTAVSCHPNPCGNGGDDQGEDDDDQGDGGHHHGDD